MLKTLFLRTVIATRVRASILAVSVFGALYFVGDFPGRQSIVLAGVGVVVFWIVWWLQKVPFVPYRVYVAPNMRSILTDFQLVENREEAWAYVQEVIEKLPHRPGNVWEYGFSVSFVTPELIYDNQWKEFRTRMKMSARVDPAGWWEDEIIPRLLSEPIRLHIEPDYRGYSLGAVLRQEYWEKVRHNDTLKGIREADVSVEDPQGGTVKVQLAVIPDEEFIFYSVYPAVMLTEEDRESAVKRRDEARAKYGWNERQEKWPSADPSTVIEHRYYTVSHSALQVDTRGAGLPQLCGSCAAPLYLTGTSLGSC